MFLNTFYSQQDDNISITRQQASSFAKGVAGDFNPIHNEDAKRFCVPGDLLFALVLNHYGLSQHMRFDFAGMVGDDVALHFPKTDSGEIAISDDNDKTYLTVKYDGEVTDNKSLISDLVRQYVAFSGQTFPHILVPLMSENNVMINPDRPLVIYESMVIEMDRLDISAPELELTNATLDVNGKRGNACIEFSVKAQGETVGHGNKTMVLSGLREYDQASIDALVNNYAAHKQAYQQ